MVWLGQSAKLKSNIFHFNCSQFIKQLGLHWQAGWWEVRGGGAVDCVFWEGEGLRCFNWSDLLAYNAFVRTMKEIGQWSAQVCRKLGQEDQALREVREERGVKGWAAVAQILQRQFRLGGKSAKQCRERYCNFASSSVRREEWSAEEEQTLLRLHNEKGNKWVQIGRQLQRPDNAVKNHYHSKLRKALRKVNRLIYEQLRGEFKPIKDSLLPKIVQTAEDYYAQTDKTQATPARTCYIMKNRFLSLLQGEECQAGKLREFVREVNYFNKTYKKRTCKRPPPPTRCNLYKGKQIIKLIQENQKTSPHAPHQHAQEDHMLSSNGDYQQESGEQQEQYEQKQEHPAECQLKAAPLQTQHIALPYMVGFAMLPCPFFFNPLIEYNYSL